MASVIIGFVIKSKVKKPKTGLFTAWQDPCFFIVCVQKQGVWVKIRAFNFCNRYRVDILRIKD